MKPRLYIFDLDGTLFRGEEATPGAVDTLKEIRGRGAIIRFLTNNSTQTRSYYAEKLKRLGFEAHESELASSSTGTAAYLKEEGLKTAYVVGEPGLIATLKEVGVRTINEREGMAIGEAVGHADATVVGLCRTFTYDLMNGAMQQILQGSRFVATNGDATYPMEAGRLIPGAGSVVAAVRTCSGHEPFIVGKPNPFLVQLILKETGVAPEQALAVGDRMDTDIESGRRAGVPTHLVLTGVEKQAPEGQPWSADLRGLLLE